MELEKFDIEKAKAGRKVVTSDETPKDVLKWDIFGDHLVYLSEGNELPQRVQIELAYMVLALAPEERYVNLYTNNVLGDLIYQDLNLAKNQGSCHCNYEGTYKLTKV